MTALRINGLRAAHRGTDVLVDVDLTVGEHVLAAVVGPSGCGKTTLLRVIAGFHRPSAGTVDLGERRLDDAAGNHHLAAEQRRVGYIPQDGALFPHLSVAANIGFGLPRARRRDVVSRLLDLVDLRALADRHPHQLSGGQQQRVALARALAPSPDLLLLDEPFTALDAGLRARVRTEVTDLLRSTGTTAILVTHDPAEALAVADQVTIMDAGRIIQTGSPDELHARPATAAAARSLGDTNLLAASLLPGTTDRFTAATSLGEVRLGQPGRPGPLTVLIRPGQVVLDRHESSGSVPATVVRVEFRGEDYRIELTVPGLDRPVIAHSPNRQTLHSTVFLSIAGIAHPLDADR